LNLYLASDSADILKVQPADISNKLKQGNITTNILLPGYLNYRLDPDRVKWFKDSSFGATSRVNLDLAPFAVFEMLVFWNKQFSDWWALLLEAMGGLRLKYIFAFSILMTLILFYWFKSVRGAGLRSAVTYSMATSGFFGMLISLVLIFSFQVNYGYLYQALGMLISVFMAGIAVGSLLISSRLNRIKNSFKFFSGLEIGMILYSLFLAWFIAQGAAQKALCNYWTYLFLFFGGGLLCGLEFPLAGNLCLIKENNIGKAVGRLYFADLFGSWLAGIFTGVVFLPVLGLTETLLVAVILKLSSLVLLTSMKWGQNYFLRTNRIKK
ncbi:MAG: hypothetical protein KJ722_03295, partial [Candidatus Omnitrophica bacterium]|nr:hypothetical protein [Candidatus Omnitrophota bacterium]